MYKFNPSTVNEATAASSQPPYTMMSVFESWPEYINLFHERPECAAEVARDLFHAQDPRYLPFILSFPTEEDIYQTPEALQFDEFLLTMLDIASSELWYIQLRETASPENFIKLSRISSQLHWTLISIGRLLITSGGKVLHPLNAELCLQCTQRLPGLWKLLWEHRSIVLVERFEGADTHILTLVRYLLECHFFMDQQFQQHTPTLESYVPHVAFYAWCHAGNLKPKNSAHSCAYIVLDILNTLSLDGLHDFTTDVVSVVIGQKNPLDVFSDALLAVDQELLQPSQLHRHLSLSMFVLRRTEDLSESEVPAESRTKALYALARAFQRYHCNGDMEGAPYASRKISKAVLYCFYAISACDQDGVAKDLNDHPYDLNFMQVVVSALDDAYVPPCDLSLAHQDSILILITLYGIYGKHARTSTIPEVARNYGYLRRLLQVHWLPVLNNLRSASRLPELKSNQNRDTLDKLLTVTEKWKQLGDVYGFSKRSREDDRLERLISYVSPEERLQGCSLTECPCYGRKAAYHKTRRVCKGCWLAFYCSTRCQKRDWKLGHRSACRSSSN